MGRKIELYLKGEVFEAELADNFLSRARGMSFRTEGKMLFRFPRESKPYIDMMFLSVPLQLVFLDAGKEVVEVQRAEPWSFDPRTWKLYRPSQPARYLLESTELLDVEVGESLEFEI
ncbi:MAG: DUF192 domain-containing protein [Candidatus Nanohaloarchaea archaeon]